MRKRYRVVTRLGAGFFTNVAAGGRASPDLLERGFLLEASLAKPAKTNPSGTKRMEASTTADDVEQLHLLIQNN